MDIIKAFNILVEFEGGLSDVKNDSGGLTKYGISQKAYPQLDIQNLTLEQARLIYEKDYWQKAGCDKLKPELQYIHFDTAVNMGVGSAVKLLQQAGGITEDGIIGPDTLVKSATVSPAEYLLYRLARYTSIVEKNPSQLLFIKGWANRVLRLMQMSRAGQL